MDTRIRMAVVGYGHFGRIHAEKIRESARAELVAIADVDGDRVDQAKSTLGVAGFTDYTDLLGKVDAVCIVVPTMAHCAVAEVFLRNDVDVLVEKPISESLDTAAPNCRSRKRTTTTFFRSDTSSDLPERSRYCASMSVGRSSSNRSGSRLSRPGEPMSM